MLGYVTLGSNDIERAHAFYDELLAVLGGKRLMQIESFVLWGTDFEQAGLAVTKPFDGNAASVGNGVMPALRAPSKEGVDQFHAKALALGATDEGAPGPRSDTFYAGYVRDLDGNKLAAFFIG